MSRYMLVLAWVVFLGFVGPWLLSSPSDLGALSSIALAAALLTYTVNRITNSITKEPKQ